MAIDRFARWLDRRSAGGTREGAGRWVLGVGIAIAVASALAVAGVHQQVDVRRRDQLELACIEQHARQLRQEETRPEPRLRGPEDKPAAARNALRVALDQLDLRDSDAAAVRRAAAAYLEEASRYLRLEEAGLWGEAWTAGQRSERGYEELLATIHRTSGVYSVQASHSLRRANLGSTLAIGAEALLIAFLSLSTERSRRAREARFRSLVQSSSDVTALLGPSREILYLSPAARRVLGYVPEEQLGTDAFAAIHPEDVTKARETFAHVLEVPERAALMEVRLRHADGSWRWVEISSANLLADPNVAGVVLNLRDVSERKALEEQLRFQALHDPLTGLANRALLSRLLAQALAAAARRPRQVALLYIDLDDFKCINDTLGHEAGDQLLVQVAQRLRAGVRREDTPARLGGDELAVLAEGLSRREAAELAERLLAGLAAPFELAGQPITIGASVGIAQAAPEESAEDLLRHADIAMYIAKTSGKGRFAVFEPAMQQRVKQWGPVPLPPAGTRAAPETDAKKRRRSPAAA
jgi:diguanylate cyclase (GGDEF)-like protein/PAS domain S-box-containing protein